MLNLTKATIYFVGPFGMGYHKLEVRDLVAYRGKWAQYPSAVHCEFVKKGGRRRCQLDPQTRFPSLVVLEGWGHPDVADAFESIGSVELGSGAVETSRGRHRAFSDAWGSEFDAFLAGYLAHNPKAKVAADFRSIDAFEPLQEAS